MLPGIRKTSPWPRIGARLLSQSSGAQARLREFYIGYGVPDTIDGRFDFWRFMHFWSWKLCGRRCGRRGVSSELVTVTFTFRGCPARPRGGRHWNIAADKGDGQCLLRQAEAYRAARRSKTEFAAALMRNLYRADPAKVEASGWMAKYALAVRRHLGSPIRAKLRKGAADFGPRRNDCDHERTESPYSFLPAISRRCLRARRRSGSNRRPKPGGDRSWAGARKSRELPARSGSPGRRTNSYSIRGISKPMWRSLRRHPCSRSVPAKAADLSPLPRSNAAAKGAAQRVRRKSGRGGRGDGSLERADCRLGRRRAGRACLEPSIPIPARLAPFRKSRG